MIGRILTLGLGSFGSVKYLITLGLDVGKAKASDWIIKARRRVVR